MLGPTEKVSISKQGKIRVQNLYFEWKKLLEMKGTSFAKPQTLDCREPTQQETRRGGGGKKKEVEGEQKSNHTSF